MNILSAKNICLTVLGFSSQIAAMQAADVPLASLTQPQADHVFMMTQQFCEYVQNYRTLAKEIDQLDQRKNILETKIREDQGILPILNSTDGWTVVGSGCSLGIKYNRSSLPFYLTADNGDEKWYLQEGKVTEAIRRITTREKSARKESLDQNRGFLAYIYQEIMNKTKIKNDNYYEMKNISGNTMPFEKDLNTIKVAFSVYAALANDPESGEEAVQHMRDTYERLEEQSKNYIQHLIETFETALPILK